MKEQIKKVLNRQRIVFIFVWVLPFLYACLYETGLLPKGICVGDANKVYILQTVGILLTIGLIPFALRMFSLQLVRRVKELPLRKALTSYRRWSDVRLSMLFVPAMINLQFYYLTMNTTGLFCAAMALIATLFCIPSESRMKNELDLPEDIND